MDGLTTEWTNVSQYVNTTQPYDNEMHYMHYLVPGAICMLLTATALVLNLLTVIVLSKFCGKLSSHLRFVLNQSILDLVATVTVVTLLGFVSPVVEIMTVVILIFVNLFMLTIDHFIAISQPLRYSSIMTRRTVNCLIVTLDVVGALFMVVFWAAVGIKWKSGECEEKFADCYTKSGEKVHTIIWHIAVVLLFLCCITLVVVYSYITVIVYRSRSIARTNPDTREKHKAAIVSFSVVVTFFAGFFLNFVVAIWIPTFSPAHVYITIFLPMNFVFDPLIYAVRLTKVKQGYRKLWMKLRCQPPESNIGSELSQRTPT